MSRLFTIALIAAIGFIAWNHEDPQRAFDDLVKYVKGSVTYNGKKS